MDQPTVEDMAAMMADGSLRDYFQFLIGRPAATKPAAAPAPAHPGYHVRNVGAWPCGTASTGPTPSSSSCPACAPAHEHPTAA